MADRRYLVAVFGALLIVGLVVLPVPYVKQSPGPIFNTIGTFDDKELIAISGTETYAPDGSLGLVTVTERGGPFGILLLGEALLGWVNPDVAIVPRSALYPEELSEEQARTRNRVAFGNSQGNAISAALGHLGRPLQLDRSMLISYILVLAAIVFRLSALWPSAAYATLLYLSGACWVGAMALYLWRFVPWLIRPRSS